MVHPQYRRGALAAISRSFRRRAVEAAGLKSRQKLAHGRNAGKRVRLPNDPQSPEFWAALRGLIGTGGAAPFTFATIIDESERLNRFIANLLDMTKLESGAVVPNSALHDLGEIVGSALERASKILAQHRVEVDLAKNLPMV